MNPRKLLALALVFVLALLSTGVLAYAQNADVEPTPSETATLTESASETPAMPVTTSAETQGPTQQPAATGTAAAETQGPIQQPAATGAAAETQGPTQQPAATGTAAETQGPTEQPAATDAAAETQGPTEQPTDMPSADPTETLPAETLPAETLPAETLPAEAQTLYDRLMACTTAEEARAILDNPEMTDEESAAMEAEISAMTEEQMDALAAHLDALGYYDVETLDKSYTIKQGDSESVRVSNMQTSTDSFSYTCSPSASITVSPYNWYSNTGYTINVGKDVPVGTYTVTVNYKVREGWGASSQIVSKTDTFTVKVTKSDSEWKYSQDYYADPNYEHVAWDVVGDYSGSKPSNGKDNATAYVKSVKMANKEVTQADSDARYPYDGYRPNRAGLTLDNYFGTGKNSKSITLSIEPQPGYYITGYWIVCCNDRNAYNCAVMGDGNEHHASFTFSDSFGTAVSDTVKTEYFGHPDTRDDQYFILVSVAPIPTPLFVDYNYGIIKDVVADSDKTIFTTPTTWTTTTSGNVYGAGKVDTQNTQYRYTYNNASESANWKHYANSVTDEAKQAAWNAGFYFAGWHAEYYAVADAKSATNDPDGKNYNYNLSNKYSAEADYAEGAEVRMLMHVKLTAQWNPIELKITKQVSGLEGAFLTNHTYSIQVQKQNSNGGWDNYGSVRQITVNGNGSASTTISGVTPGVYRAVEVESSRGDLTTGGKTMYVTVTDSGTVTYGSTPGTTTAQELVVKNEYTSVPPYCDLTVKKTLSGNMYNENDTFEFTVKFGDTEEKFSLGNNGSKTISVPVGAVVTVTEVPGDYTYALSAVSPTTLAYTGVSNGISFTMPEENVTVVVNNSNNETITTGVLVDSLPYILILAVVVAVGVLVFIRRRRERDD